jgi:TonB-dependent SusC/RagA subfamily outer membrane receptor
VFVAVNALGQHPDSVRADSSKKFMIVDAKEVTTKDRPLYVVDGVVLKQSIEHIRQGDILNAAVLKQPAAVNIYGSQGANGVVLITTRPYAIARYQEKLGRFSKEYREYITWQMKYNHNDNGVFYVFENNGSDDPLLTGDKLINKLLDIPVSKIAKVELKRKETCCGTNVSVIITEKN